MFRSRKEPSWTHYHWQICTLFAFLPYSLAYFGLTSKDPLVGYELGLPHQNIIQERIRNGHLKPAQLCNIFKLQRKQKKMCKRDKGVPEVLNESIKLSLLGCQQQFRYERWNCTLGQYHLDILKKGFKETSYLYAISSAALVHSFAHACSRGILDRCTCDISKRLRNKEAWKWGSCGDNIRYGVKFTRKFLRRAKRSGKDLRAKIDQHNTNIGIEVVRRNVNRTCKCYGVSGSCTTRTCWRQLAPFSKISAILKEKYEKAVRVNSFSEQRLNSIGDNLRVKHNELLYIEKSPSFCRRTRYSSGISGRVCMKGENCKVMCCGRGYNVESIDVQKHCLCNVISCCHVKCKICNTKHEVHTCK
ncbi:protein Wnt-9a isoform X1 [Octopus bimaculoides]|uniref:protein Wnt-9a isoform X1 n=2 Tax=Octopus bimaculoides TaxID=37653 RepID=UPI00071C42FC|nr:protein Wnt-9a isoform X1 [Octopus bimaculoides]|eukprot:XP_014788848.1 PREDICTED: protein Wnt-9a-like [Octopus bimaculoides]